MDTGTEIQQEATCVTMLNCIVKVEINRGLWMGHNVFEQRRRGALNSPRNIRWLLL
jgi:hypothetical protein